MSQNYRVVFTILILALLTPAATSASAPESLYNSKEAKKISPGLFSIFGPKAGNFRYDKRMIHAAEIAAARAKKHSTSRCWRYVKDALVASNTIQTRPTTAYAKQAANELTTDYGFKQIRETNPYTAPLGSVIVYGGRGAGHVEIRTAQGFVSDFVSPRPSPRPLIGIYIKPRA